MQTNRDMVTTRWWWVRHAPVREDGGCIYGQKDLGCDTSDRVVFEAVGKILPRNAVWYASNLKRTHQTASAIWAAGYPRPSDMPHVNAFAEQHLGELQGMNRAAFLRQPAGAADTGLPVSTNPRPAARVSWTSTTGSAPPSSRLNTPAGWQGHHRRRAWRHDQGGRRPCARRPAGQRPRLRYRQLLGDAARSSFKRQLHRMAAADGQPAALDRGRFA